VSASGTAVLLLEVSSVDELSEDPADLPLANVDGGANVGAKIIDTLA
jgi:hypothetical protein